MSIIDPLRNEPVDWTFKGLPALPDEDVSALKGLSIFDPSILYPIATLSQERLRRNGEWMKGYLRQTKVKIAPHGKTTMAPALFNMQMGDGAWGMTAATPHHVRAYRRFEVQRIIFANQLVGEAAVRLVTEELKRDPDFEFWCLVDSSENAKAVAAAAKAADCPRPISMLLEVGAEGGRTGARTDEAALKVAETVAANAPWITLNGVECFEGIFGGEDADEKATQLIRRVADTALLVNQHGLFADGPVMLTAGGSAYFDVAAQTLASVDLGRETQVVLRSGCYIAHDAGFYDERFRSIVERDADARSVGGALSGALHVWGQVQSAPEPTRMLCTLGKRDVGNDIDPPFPLAAIKPTDGGVLFTLNDDHKVVGLNDQHAYLDVPADTPLTIGDVVCFGVSHPCTTFDKWRMLYIIDDDYRIVDIVRTYF